MDSMSRSRQAAIHRGGTGLLAGLVLGAALLLPLAVRAHSPICFCFVNDDGDITCEGGFSDGASAEGVAIRILDNRDRVLIGGKMNEKSEFTFERPRVGFHVVFDAGDEHVVTIFEDEIE